MREKKERARVCGPGLLDLIHLVVLVEQVVLLEERVHFLSVVAHQRDEHGGCSCDCVLGSVAMNVVHEVYELGLHCITP